jgi:tRNA (guanine-N7-)-methyltransferase
VLAVITPMVQLIEASGGFDRPAADGRPWRAGNPLAVPTERETYVLSQGLPVYRVLYQRNDRCPSGDQALHNPSAENPLAERSARP